MFEYPGDKITEPYSLCTFNSLPNALSIPRCNLRLANDRFEVSASD